MQETRLKIGILGGGQLAQMLVNANPYFDASFSILTDQPDCPAKYTNATICVGNYKDSQVLRRFLKDIHFLTFENEFIDVQYLNEIRKDFPKLFILPELRNIQVLQNKLFQKFEFKKLSLPTSEFVDFNTELDDLDVWLKTACTQFKNQFVIKWAMGGYDGKGNFVFKNIDQFSEAKKFCELALSKSTTVYAEKFILFKNELAQVYCRSMNGDFVSYPLVVSQQENSICKLVYGPATEFDIHVQVEQETNRIGKSLAEALGYVGTFAVEYFLGSDGKIMINEMAPRVHNSGHYTLDATKDNQFAHHIRAILGAKLSAPATYNYFAMLNLIGDENRDYQSLNESLKKELENNEEQKIYWYNKTELRRGRKMGHINTIAMTKPELLKKIEQMKSTDKKIWELL